MSSESGRNPSDGIAWRRRRYLESAANGWQLQLFVPPSQSDACRVCGRWMLESAEGDRPVSTVWVPATPLPAHLFRDFSAVRGLSPQSASPAVPAS